MGASATQEISDVKLSTFGFRKTPFTREITDEERWPLPHQNEVVDALEEAVVERMSCALIAPAGCGKTVALRALRERLPEARYQHRYVKVTGLSKRDLCKEIASVCGLTPAGSYPALVRKLQDSFVYRTSTDGIRPILVLDEAHDLRLDSLAMLRVITNFEMDSKLVLSVVLAGQPPLRTMLARAECEAIAQRLAHFATLRLLSREEARAYVEHRCTLAGAKSDPFDESAHEAIFEMSRGNLRAIDRLSLKALQLAAKAGASAVCSAHVIAARQQLWP
jgi:general secretion pathway protein A